MCGNLDVLSHGYDDPVLNDDGAILDLLAGFRDDVGPGNGMAVQRTFVHSIGCLERLRGICQRGRDQGSDTDKDGQARHGDSPVGLDWIGMDGDHAGPKSLRRESTLSPPESLPSEVGDPMGDRQVPYRAESFLEDP